MKIKLTIVGMVILFMSNITIAQEITMFQGFWSMKYYEDDKKISKSEVETLMLNDAEANQYWRKSELHQKIAIAGIVAYVGFSIWGINEYDDNQLRVAPLVGSIASLGVTLGFSLSSSNNKRKAILRYNKTHDVATINIGPTYNGMGLVLNF